VAGVAEQQGVKLVTHVRNKAEDGSAQLKIILGAVQAAHDTKETILGTLPKEKHAGKLAETFSAVLQETPGIHIADVSAGFAEVFAVKDPTEILNHKKAAMLASRVLNDFVVSKIESVIDEGRVMKHSKLAEQTEEVIVEPAKIQVKLKADNCDVAYPPIIQSGGKYDLKVSAGSDDHTLHHGVIVVALGTRYAFYCANLSRTFVINPTPTQVGHLC
jgi:nucleosome binding factor SPN SPT16 subunit